MIKLKDLIFEDKESEIQTYVDIISMNPDKPSYQKYKKKLKDKYGIDYDKEYGQNDEGLINNASLDNIKEKDDFLNFRNYQKYAKEIFHLRGIGGTQPKQPNKVIPFDEVVELSNKLGVDVNKRSYSGRGNYAQASGKLIEVPDPVSLGVLIHELGHVYHNEYYRDGVASKITNASSSYGIGQTDEVFAENFMNYFLAPNWLKSNLKEVYNDLDRKINSKWKKQINSIIR